MCSLVINLLKFMWNFLFHQFKRAIRDVSSNRSSDAGPAFLEVKHEISLFLGLKFLVLGYRGD